MIAPSRDKRFEAAMGNYSGKCMCGSISWTYTGETTRNLVCHCSDCQRATSSPFTAFLGLKSERLEWVGDIVDFMSSPGTFRGFCPTCGTRLYFRSSKWPGEIHVHAATMDIPGDYHPSAQVVLRSKASWLDRLNRIPAYDGFQASPSVAEVSQTTEKSA